MKKIYLTILTVLSVAMAFATTHTVTNSGAAFTPDSLYIEVGDTVVWAVGATHPVLEVDQTDYDANNNLGNGGFSIPSGNGMETATFTASGTYYYICTNHIGSGMKGKIVVAAPVSTGTPMITMIADGDCTGGTPKVLEFYANGTVDYSLFSIEIQTNSGTSWGNNLDLSVLGTVTDGFSYLYKEAASGLFNTEFPSATNAHVSTASALNFNGDDRIRLLLTSSMTVIDAFGIDGTDGTGTGWEYKDGYSKRNDGTSANAIFNEVDWTTSNGTLNNEGSCQGAATFGSIIQIGSYTSILVPEVSFKTDSFTFNEGDLTVHLDSLLMNPAIMTPAGEQFEIHLGPNSTADATDFVVSTGGTVAALPIIYPIIALTNFTALPLDATIVDDNDIEGNEVVEIILRNSINGLNIGADSVLYLTIIDNDFPIDTLVDLNSMSMTKNEGDGSFDIIIDYGQSSTNSAHTVDLQMITGDVADIDNYTTQTITFNSISETVTVNLTDDALVEGVETITFALVNPSIGLMIDADSVFTLTLEDNDVAISTIGSVNVNDDAIAASNGQHVKVQGVVNSIDRGFNSLEFSMQDATGGITIYTDAAMYIDSMPNVGDELELEGMINFSNGLVRLESLMDWVNISTGNTVAEVVTLTPTDMNESSLIRINGLTLIDPSQWVAVGGSGFNVDATNPNGDTVIIRIDRDYDDLYNSLAPNSAIIDVIGVANQFDISAPFDEDYQIIPRDLNDIILYPTLNMNAQGNAVGEDAGTVTVDFTVANAGAGPYTVDVALTSGTAEDIDNFTDMTSVSITGGSGSIDVTITDDTDVEGNETFVFTLSNPSAGLYIGTGKTYELTVNDNDSDAISEINVNGLKLYPNPANDKVILSMISNEKQIANISIVDALGRKIQTNTFMLENGENKIELDLTKVTIGNYTITIATENGIHTENLMVK